MSKSAKRKVVPPPPSVFSVRPFLPAKNFALSTTFYNELGWLAKPIDRQLAIVECGTKHFFLQDYYVKEWAENSMFWLDVENAAAWYDHASRVLRAKGFGDARVMKPKLEPYGALVTRLWDPSGVLFHLSERVQEN